MAILKINGEELLETHDDGAFLDVLKEFFQCMGKLEDNEQGNGYIKSAVSNSFAYKKEKCS